MDGRGGRETDPGDRGRGLARKALSSFQVEQVLRERQEGKRKRLEVVESSRGGKERKCK